MYVNEIEDPSKRRSVVKWKDRVKEYMHKRGAEKGGGLEHARMECVVEVEALIP